MGTKNNPGNFDCYAKAEPDEPMFVLLARDRMAASLVLMWAGAREIEEKTAPEKIIEAKQCAVTMLEWALAKGIEPVHVVSALPFDILKRELELRGATVTAAPYGGDFARGQTQSFAPCDESPSVDDPSI